MAPTQVDVTTPWRSPRKAASNNSGASRYSPTPQRSHTINGGARRSTGRGRGGRKSLTGRGGARKRQTGIEDTVGGVRAGKRATQLSLKYRRMRLKYRGDRGEIQSSLNFQHSPSGLTGKNAIYSDMSPLRSIPSHMHTGESPYH